MVAYASFDGMLVPLQRDWTLSVDAISILSLSVLAGSMLMLLPAGELVDRWGSRRMLRFGTATAIAGAVLVMAAFSTPWLVAGRVVGGVGGMALAVASMAQLNRSLTDDRERAYVFGLFAAVTSTIFAASPLLASVISDQLTWRLVPLLWIAFAIIAVLLVPDDSAATGTQGELVTPLLAGVALSSLCVAMLISEESTIAAAVFLIVTALAICVLLLRRRWLRHHERKSGLDLSVFRAPGAPALMGVMVATAVVNVSFYGNLLLQYRYGLTSTQAAFVLVVPQVAGVIGGLMGGAASARLGSLPVTAIALGVGCVAGLAFQVMDVASPATTMVVPLSLFGLAAGCLTGSLAKSFLDCADPAASGAASSWRQAGWSIGATFGGVVTSALVLGSFTRTWVAALTTAGIDVGTARWVADSVRAGAPLSSLSSSPTLDGVVNREAIDSLVGLAAAQVDTFRLVGLLAALTYGLGLALVLLAMRQQRRGSVSAPL
jgi:hypothetical protein